MSAVYSPLCNTDKSAYFAYLISIITDNGSASRKIGSFGGFASDEGCSSGRDYVGKSLGLVAALSGVEGSERASSVGLLVDTLRLDGARGGSFSVDGKEFGIVGSADGSVGGVSGGHGGGYGDEFASGDATFSGVAVKEDQALGESGVGVSDEMLAGEVKCQGDEGTAQRASGAGVSVPVLVSGAAAVSEKTLANRQRRRQKKELKKARQVGMKRDDWRARESGKVSSSSVGLTSPGVGHAVEKTELRVSLEQKWMAQNAVAMEKAKQELELIKLRDIAKEAKKREVAVTRQTECNKVAIEQAFGSLKATGNVPGFCATVVSDATTPSLTSGSISPNSSVSEAEIRKAVKELEDSRVEIAKLKRRLRDRDIADLRDGVTVAFSADMSEGLRKEIDDACDGMPTEYDIPEDLDTVYVKKSGSFQFQ